MIKQVFEKLAIDLETIRTKLSNDPFPVNDITPKNNVREMSFECRANFNHAKDIAEKHGFKEASCIHLIISIFEHPNQKIRNELAMYDLMVY